jgi:FKBP-type peptidyl-prolyl cis-trans isomerase 2
MTTPDLWTYRDQFSPDEIDLVGYKVEATDGSIGKVDDATFEVGGSYVVVDTGPWIFGKRVLLPAGVIERVDQAEEKIYVGQTKNEIKNSPEFDDTRYRDEAYRDELTGYYGGATTTAGRRDDML